MEPLIWTVVWILAQVTLVVINHQDMKARGLI
jgi:hypothetical protein